MNQLKRFYNLEVLRWCLIGLMVINGLVIAKFWSDFTEERRAQAQAVSPLLPEPEIVEPEVEKIETESALEPPQAQEQAGLAIEAPSEPGLSSSEAPLIESNEVKEIARQNLVRVETDTLSAVISLEGGDLVDLKLRQFSSALNSDERVRLLSREADALYIVQTGTIGRDGLDGSKTRPLYLAGSEIYELGDEESLMVPIVYRGDGIIATKSYIFRKDSYEIEMVSSIENLDESPWQGFGYAQILRDEHSPKVEEGKFGIRTFLGGAISSPDERYSKLSFKEMAEGYSSDHNGGWIAFIQHYFVTALLPWRQEQLSSFQARRTPSGHYALSIVSGAIEVAPGDSASFGFRLYSGPKEANRLSELADTLSLSVDYGWLWFLSQPLFSALNWITGYVENWGLGIVILTVLIKLIFFPLTHASYVSMAKMRKVMPYMKSLRERYADDRQALSREMMNLYKREKVNPLGGCLPILVQMPVFIALYWMLIESVELRHASFYLWIEDLSARDPWFVLPVLMIGTMYVQQLLAPPPADPTQARIFRLMPLIFGVFVLWLPAGLTLYWVVNGALSIAQQMVINWRIQKMT